MFAGLTTNALAQIKIVEELIAVHEGAIIGKDASTRRGMKLYSVSSCATRLYAIYENFVESLLSDFLDALPALFSYADLSATLKDDYRIGISHVLSRSDSGRYAHLKHENIIKWYHEALTNTPSYRFVAEALTYHEKNLRLNVVENLLARVQIKDLRGWLTHNQNIVGLYTEKAQIFEQLEAEVNNFIQLRNDAAHGVLEDLEGKENLTRLCELVRAVILAISSYIHKCLLMHRLEAGKMQKIGDVSEVFSQAGAFIAKLSNAVGMKAGMSIHLVGQSYCVEQTVQSLRVNDVQVDSIVAGYAGYEVGVQCPTNPRLNAELYVETK